MKQRYLIGVDEAGRGPLAGPVSVGVVCVPIDFNWDVIPGVNDSKKLSEKKREIIFGIAQLLQKEGKIDYSVKMEEAVIIDMIGIVPAIKKAMKEALTEIVCEDVSEYSVKLDGSLMAPAEFIHQETIIKGDAKEKVIGLASILAKVTRDRYMVGLAKKKQFKEYGLDIHKGYGTKYHRESILRHGLSVVHRKSYCRKLMR